MDHNLILSVLAFTALSVLIIVSASGWYKEALASGDSRLRACFNAGFFFSLLYFLMFVVEPALILLWREGSGYFLIPMPSETIYSLLSKAMFYGIAGYAAFVLGYRMKIFRKIGKALPYFSLNRVNKPLLITVVILYFLISFFGLYLYGIDTLFYVMTHPQTRVETLAGTGYLFFAVQFYLAAVLLLYAHHLDSRKRSAVWGLFLWILPVTVLAFGGRTHLLQIWMAMLIIYVFKQRKPNFTQILTSLILIVSTTGLYFIYRQYVTSSQGMGSFSDIEEAPLKFLWSIRHSLVPFDNFMAYLDVFQSNLNYQYGSPFINILHYIAPGGFFDLTPVEPGVELAQVIYPGISEGTGTPYTIVGFLHNNFSLPGILVGMFFLGASLRALNSYLRTNIEQNSVIIIYSVVLGRLIIVLWGVFYAGVLGYAQFFLQFVIAFALLSGFKMRKKVERQYSAPPGYEFNESL
jgi:oligosaccharide repeat unit polymerase